MQRLVAPPTSNWDLDHDAQLVQLASLNKLVEPSSLHKLSELQFEPFPLLKGCSIENLARRFRILLRYASLLDECWNCLMDDWQLEEGDNPLNPFATIFATRPLFPLAVGRWTIVQMLLEDSAVQEAMPIIFIDRRKASEAHDGSTPNYDDSMTIQAFRALRTGKGRKLTYRYSSKCKQWWEVNYRGEGIIDQGGGFRDLLSEISEELCPSERGSPPKTNFFIRSPNNTQNSGEYRDAYVLNSDCSSFAELEWVWTVFLVLHVKVTVISPIVPILASGESSSARSLAAAFGLKRF
eukprot:m.154722 g.154722  ORF g.154722 m.154722 type:complete len:295 (-) comp10196_c0_seq4:919-1803(-)